MQDWWRGAVIYQIYPRSFQDDNGDGIGDLPGITRRLDHVAELGADGIWLSPFFTSPMADMGYDVSDYTDVDPQFGTLADFDALIARAHALGLKVIIDQVISHTSDQHAWFTESRSSRDNPRADWYVWADPLPDGSPPNNWPSVFGGSAWEWEPNRRQYYMHNFLARQPDLNYHCPALRDAIVDTMRFWLDRGVDGFRLDTVNYYFHDDQLRSNPPIARDTAELNHYDMQDHIYSKSRPENVAFLERLRALTDSYPERTMVGEVGDRDRAIPLMSQYTTGTKRLHMAYSFDMLSPEFSPAHFRKCIEGFFDGAPDGWPKWSFSNHDVVRHVTRWGAHAADPDLLARQSIALLMSFQGTIGIYQGEELGLTETDLAYDELTDPVGLKFWPENKGRDGCRTPMVWEADAPGSGFSTGDPWLPVKPPQAARAVSTQRDDPDSLMSYYRTVIAWRKSRPELLTGTTEFLDLPHPAFGFWRRTDKAALLCLHNLSPDPLTLTLSGAGAEGADTPGPSQAATWSGGALTLGGNGFVHLAPSGPVTVAGA